jgi:pimeloyl-ACP methyl ester carboxylesterase
MRIVALTGLFVLAAFADDGQRLLRIDHHVAVKSTVPAIAGQTTQIYVREVVVAGAALRGPVAPDKVVLFVHGAGTPAEVAFDAGFEDYSWMAYLAKAGYDAFSMDMTGYGRSTRPAFMNDPCNLAKEQQALFVPALMPTPCAATYSRNMTTVGSDWDDISAVVDHILALRHVPSVNLVGWSLGGPRSGGYTAQNSGKVRSLVLLAPAYSRSGRTSAPDPVPATGVVFNTQTHAEFLANWDRQVGCPNQYDPAAAEAVWKDMLDSDPVGATWGTGVRRAPQTTSWGWNAEVVRKVKTPVLAIGGALDKQVVPSRVRELVEDLGSDAKVFGDLGCSSHNALWERNHLALFQASLEWFSKGTVGGVSKGEVKLGSAR